MLCLLHSMALLSLFLCFTHANAFERVINHNKNVYRSFKIKILSMSSQSQSQQHQIITKYKNKESELFSNNIQSILSIGPIPLRERQFLINGWRWHTASSLRDLHRYFLLIDQIEIEYDAKKINNKIIKKNIHEDIKKRLINCYDYVCDYNLKALLKIETELFFPWLQKLLPISSNPLMSEIIQESTDVKLLSQQIGELLNIHVYL